jgi:hypothetical protein
VSVNAAAAWRRSSFATLDAAARPWLETLQACARTGAAFASVSRIELAPPRRSDS